VVNVSSERLGEFAQIGNGLGFQVCSGQTVSCAATVQETSQIWGGFSQKSRSYRRIRQSRHFMQTAQSRINTGDSAYR
jgi:hypothetical protein